MPFTKGHTIWLGRKKTPEQINKTRIALMKRVPCNCLVCGVSFEEIPSRIKDGKGKFCSRICSDKSKIGKTTWNKGKKMSAEAIKKMSEHQKNNPSRYWLGKIRYDLRGENNWKWIADRNKLKKYKDSEEKRSPAYKRWRIQILRRDNYKCRIADNNCGGRLEIHHILPWRDFVELRYEINNGITLCHAHHPRVRAEEKRLILTFQELVSVSN